MYSLTWTEKDFPCSAMYDTDCCTSHKLVFDNYLDAAVEFLELFLDEDDVEKVTDDKDDKAKFLSGVGKYDEKLISRLEISAVLAESEA